MIKSTKNEFEILLTPHMENAIRFCRGLCYRLTNEDAEDILQNALLKAFRFFHQLSDRDKFKPWLFTIIANSFKSHMRNRFIPFSGLIENEKDDAFPAVYRQDPELSESFRHALNCLRKKERAAILLYEVAGFSMEEIRIMQKEKSISAVKSRLSRARMKLREIIRNEDMSKLRKQSSEVNEMKGDIDNETINLIKDLQV